MQFEWDETKAANNWRKHGITFAAAARVFRDRFHLPVQDRHVDGEERWQTTGYVEGLGLVVVAHTWSDDDVETIRIISARRAEPHERRAYENG